MIPRENSNFQFLTSFSYLGPYSELSCETYASFGGGGSQILNRLTFL